VATGQSEAIKPQTTRLDYVLAAGLVLVIALVSYQQLSSDRAGTEQAGVADARNAAASPATAVSIAVLPFSNVSADAGQEFFADGMTDEISGALAKIPDLRVVARTSAFQFKGQNANISAISQALNATHLIEGTVRRDGDRVRISVQLVQANDGLQMWSENYDRNLTDIFAIQEEIARSVATSLGMELGLSARVKLTPNRTEDLTTYQDYLRARALFRARSLPEVIALSNSIVTRDPDYAPAWALLALAEGIVVNRDPAMFRGSPEERRRLRQMANDRRERAAREAMRLDPTHPSAMLAQAHVESGIGNWAEAEKLFREALAADPTDPEILDRFSIWIVGDGRVKEALGMRQQLRVLEPFVPFYNIVTADVLHLSGQNEAAIALLETVPPDIGDEFGNRNRALRLAQAYAALRRYGEAADALLTMRSDLVSRESLEAAAQLLRAAPARAPDGAPALEPAVDFVYVHVGAPERVMENYERDLEASLTGLGGFVDWAPEDAAVRKLESFKAYVRRSGLLAHWHTHGWPDLCRPVGADDFVCD
jgi:TolB-like protein